jgi:phosphoglycolate phosphatase-like HAD superfamily hydrolase
MAGNRNKAFTIGVATGKDSREELAAAHAAAVVSDLTKASGIHEILMQPFFS